MKELPGYVHIHTADGRKRRWRLVWLPKGHHLLDGGYGKTESPTTKGKRIFLQMNQTPEDLFDTIVHEVAHAAGWNLAEEWVWFFASDITCIMRKLGYEFKKVK